MLGGENCDSKIGKECNIVRKKRASIFNEKAAASSLLSGLLGDETVHLPALFQQFQGVSVQVCRQAYANFPET